MVCYRRKFPILQNTRINYFLMYFVKVTPNRFVALESLIYFLLTVNDSEYIKQIKGITTHFSECHYRHVMSNDYR